MKDYWEDDTFIMYDDDEDNNENICWQDILGGIIFLAFLFFTGYGIVSFVKDIF